MIRTAILSLALLFAACSTAKSSTQPAEPVAQTSSTSATANNSQAPSIEPGEDWLFWAEGNVFVVDDQVWWTGEDLNEKLAKAPPRVPPKAREMDEDVARSVVNSYVAAAIQVKAYKALVDWHVQQQGVKSTDTEIDAWYDAVQQLVAGPEERQLLARFAGRERPLVDEEGMRRAAARNAHLAALMQKSGAALATREDARKLYDSDPDAWEVPSSWTVQLLECPDVETCEKFRASVVERPDQFENVAATRDGYRGKVTLRAQAGTPARKLLNAFEARDTGTLTPVVELGGSAWVARLVRVDPAHTPDFDEVAETIVATQRIGALNQFEEALIRELLANHDVRILWDNVRFRVGDQVAVLQPPRTAKPASEDPR